MTKPDWRDLAYSGGFLLTTESLTSVAHFSEQALPGGWRLWSDDAVSTEIAEADSGEFVLLRGDWVDLALEAKSNTAEELVAALALSQEQFHERLSLVGGRFVVIFRWGFRTLVCNDAMGFRSVYYATDQPWISSHLSLLEQFVVSPRTLKVIEALPAMDLSPNPEIRTLLPNFALDLHTRSPVRYYPTRDNPFTEAGVDERLNLIEKLCHTYLEDYARRLDRVAFSLTAGQDSRFMLALAMDHGIDVSAFTYGVPESVTSTRKASWAASMKLDFDVVRTLLPHTNLANHHFVDISAFASPPVPDTLTQEELTLIRRNTWASHAFFLVGIYRKLFSDGRWAHWRGSGTEIARRARAPENDTLAGLINNYRGGAGDDATSAALRLGYDQHLFGYNRWDLAYWEIRMGKWHAEIMNEHDAAFSTSFSPLGARRILDLFMSFTPHQRREAYAIRELINRKAPVLNFIGVNDRRNLYEQQRDTLFGGTARPD